VYHRICLIIIQLAHHINIYAQSACYTMYHVSKYAQSYGGGVFSEEKKKFYKDANQTENFVGVKTKKWPILLG